jgi:hypothetical protein
MDEMMVTEIALMIVRGTDPNKVRAYRTASTVIANGSTRGRRIQTTSGLGSQEAR